MGSDTYLTIKEQSQGIYKDKGSKFLAFAYPVSSEDEIQLIYKQLKKKYYDAHHHVYAFRLGAEKKIFRASDDGEPSNSSGPPILGQIRSHDLTNIFIVVVRYFGGTKLGVPGLINAYKSAAEDVIINSHIVTRTVNDLIRIKFDYSQMNLVKKIIKDENLEELEQKFDLTCSITVSIRQTLTQKIIDKIRKLEFIQFEIIGKS